MSYAAKSTRTLAWCGPGQRGPWPCTSPTSCSTWIHQLALPSTAPLDVVTVAEGELRVLAESYTEHLVVVCVVYLSTLAVNLPEPVVSLAGRQEVAASVLVSHQGRDTSRRLVGRVRRDSLGEGGLWAVCLAWLVGLKKLYSDLAVCHVLSCQIKNMAKLHFNVSKIVGCK